MVALADLKVNPSNCITGYRLINSKYPPIHLFDDVANSEEFEAIYRIQTRTNPRLQNELGNIKLLPHKEIPFGIPGCSYACAPFVHVNPDGSRFSDGMFGVLYIADSIETALAEVTYHQEQYWEKVAELKFERFVFRALLCKFNEVNTVDALPCKNDPIYDSDSYEASRVIGRAIKKSDHDGIRFNSVRNEGGCCWGLTTPQHIKSIVQKTHHEMVWNSGVIAVSKLSNSDFT